MPAPGWSPPFDPARTTGGSLLCTVSRRPPFWRRCCGKPPSGFTPSRRPPRPLSWRSLLFWGRSLAWRRDLSSLAGIVAAGGFGHGHRIDRRHTRSDTILRSRWPSAQSLWSMELAATACWTHAWIIALAVDFCAFLLAYLLTRPQGLPEGYAPFRLLRSFAIQWALVAVYLTSTTVPHIGARAWHALVRDRAAGDYRRAGDRKHIAVDAWNERAHVGHRRRLSRGRRRVAMRPLAWARRAG